MLLIAGDPTGEQLKALCVAARARGNDVVVVTDALEDASGALAGTLAGLNEKLFQLSPTAVATMLLKGISRFYYPFARPSVTATIAVFVGEQVLVIERRHQPFKGCESLPGGFLNAELEDLPTCAARELFEETGLVVAPGELKQVDVRSKPERDERGHVVDVGFAWFVPAERHGEVLAEVKAGDDGSAVRLVPVKELIKRPMAFDHKELLVAALNLVDWVED